MRTGLTGLPGIDLPIVKAPIGGATQTSTLLSASASMDNPLGGVSRGWPEIKPIYERIFSGPSRVSVEFFDYTLHVFDDIFLAVGRERGALQADNEVLNLAIRTTRVFRFTGGRWRQLHHHGSMDDPALLAAYQAVVRRER